MSNYDDWKTTDVEAERAYAESSAAEEECLAWCKDEIGAVKAPTSQWSDSTTTPDASEDVIDRYRFWLYETDHQDSTDSRRLFEEVLFDEEMGRWNRRCSVAWWS